MHSILDFEASLARDRPYVLDDEEMQDDEVQDDEMLEHSYEEKEKAWKVLEEDLLRSLEVASDQEQDLLRRIEAAGIDTHCRRANDGIIRRADDSDHQKMHKMQAHQMETAC